MAIFEIGYFKICWHEIEYIFWVKSVPFIYLHSSQRWLRMSRAWVNFFHYSSVKTKVYFKNFIQNRPTGTIRAVKLRYPDATTASVHLWYYIRTTGLRSSFTQTVIAQQRSSFNLARQKFVSNVPTQTSWWSDLAIKECDQPYSLVTKACSGLWIPRPWDFYLIINFFVLILINT